MLSCIVWFLSKAESFDPLSRGRSENNVGGSCVLSTRPVTNNRASFFNSLDAQHQTKSVGSFLSWHTNLISLSAQIGDINSKREGSFVLLNEDKKNSHTNYLAHHSNLDCTKEIKGPNEVIVDDHPLHICSAQCYRPHQRDDFQTYGNKKKRWTIII